MSAGALVAALAAILLPLAVNEAKDWFPRLAVALVRWAARRLGEPQACARYEEEWAANVEAVPGKLSPLVSAFGYVVVLPRMRRAVRRGPRLLNTKPARLPANPGQFVGRLEELAALDDGFSTYARTWRRRRSRSVVVVTGTAGAGKTSLALRWAHQNKQRFPDGVLYVNLRGYDSSGPPRETSDVLPRFLRDLGVRAADVPVSVDEQIRLYRSVVSRRRMLIVLDNAATVRHVQPLLPNTSLCLAVVTSRAPLAGLVAHDGVHQVALGVLGVEEAVELLEAVVGFDRIDAQREVAQELARLCSCLPLALRIAADRLASRPRVSISDLVRDLRNESKLWDAHSSENGDEADAVGAVFGWSYRALPEEAAWVFRHLARLSGNSFTQNDVVVLLGVDPATARQLIEILVGAHMLEESRQPGVYVIHELLREYARERLEIEEPDRVRVIRDSTPSRTVASAALRPGGYRLRLRQPARREP